MTLIELSAEACQLSHDLDEAALGLRILKLDPFSLLILLIELFLEYGVFIEGSC